MASLWTLIGFLFLGAVYYLWTQTNKLKSRVSELERQVEAQQNIGDSESFLDEKTEDLPLPDENTAPQVVANPWENPSTHLPAQQNLKGATTTIPAAPRRQYVFNRGNLIQSANWLKQNWFLAIAALSLALSGVFLVQYGVENGFLSPFWRVISAAVLGIWLIWLGEFVRRRWGDKASDHSAYLPSTFSGAGLVALFSAVLAARQLYGLIGPEAAMVWLVGVSIVAVVLGWFYGPFLAVVGLLGSFAAPFLVGGDSAPPQLFYYYFAIVAVAGLLVDAVKKWAWVSAIGLIFAFAAALIIFSSGIGNVHILGFALIVALGAVTIPSLSLIPTHAGKMISDPSGWFPSADAEQSEFPTRIASCTFVAAGLAALMIAVREAGAVEVWLALLSLGLMYVASIVWFKKAPALSDTAIVPLVLFLVILVLQSFDYGPLYAEFRQAITRPPETSPPATVTVFSIAGMLASVLAFWRGSVAGKLRTVWLAGAALIAPLVLIVLEVWWKPAAVLGTGSWAIHVMIAAALMVLFVERTVRSDGPELRRASIFLLSALSLISFAMVITLSTTALTLSLAVMILVAALIDRRFDMPMLTFFMQISAIVISGRLVVYPGMFWAIDSPVWELLFAYGGVIALMSAAWLVQVGMDRKRTQVILESVIWVLAGVLISVLLYKWLDDSSRLGSHWGVSLMAVVWTISMGNQLYRLKLGGLMRWLRIGLAAVFGLIATLLYALLFTVVNPLVSGGELIVGPLVVDSLLVAFGFPAVLFAILAWRLRNLEKPLRYAFGTFAAAFSAYYVAMEIRRVWQGDNLHVPGVMAGELYSNTVAILLVSIVVLLVAFNRRSTFFRRVAIFGIGLTIAKVFLIDMSGLDGLYRVASFLGLGLSMAGLAWLYRQMSEQWDVQKAPE